MSYNRYKNTQKRKNYLLIHNKEKYDRVSIILPKGTKEKIKRLDIKSSLNHFINMAIYEKLNEWNRMVKMTYKLINDNCFNWMKNREENSITTIVTDPPYGVKEYTEEELKKREMHLEVYGEFLQPLMAEKEVHCQDFLLSMTVHWKETMYIIFY